MQCHGGNQAPPNGNMEWYSYTPDQDYIVTVESFDTSVDDTRFQVYGGSCGNLYCVGGDDDSGISNYSSDTFNVRLVIPTILHGMMDKFHGKTLSLC